MRIFSTGLASALVLTLALSMAEAAGWRTYVNPRFGATAEVPSGWKAGEEPANGDGLDFTSPDGNAVIAVYGGLNISDTVAEAIADQATPNDGETITYTHTDPHSVVVSGTKGGRIFYRKSILVCRDQIWDSVSLEYPAAEKRAYDAIVTHVAGSLRAGQSAQIPDCR